MFVDVDLKKGEAFIVVSRIDGEVTVSVDDKAFARAAALRDARQHIAQAEFANHAVAKDLEEAGV